jgi:hypothetical protein
MAYIGREPIVGNFQKCDAITTSGTTTFNLLVGSVAVFPESANHCIVSLNGVIQAPTSAFTISGSTIIFNSALTSADVIDFVILLGNVLDLGTPSDGTVTNAKLSGDVISGETDIGGAIADADLFLLDDGAGGTLRKTAASRIKTYVGTNTPAFAVTLSGHQSIANETETKVTFDTEAIDSDSAFASNKFTVPSGEGGTYLISYSVTFNSAQNSNADNTYLKLYKNGTGGTVLDEPGFDFKANPVRFFSLSSSKIVTLVATDYLEVYAWHSAAISDSGVQLYGGTGRSYFCGVRLY